MHRTASALTTYEVPACLGGGQALQRPGSGGLRKRGRDDAPGPLDTTGDEGRPRGDSPERAVGARRGSPSPPGRQLVAGGGGALAVVLLARTHLQSLLGGGGAREEQAAAARQAQQGQGAALQAQRLGAGAGPGSLALGPDLGSEAEQAADAAVLAAAAAASGGASATHLIVLANGLFGSPANW
jgi:hypothetical protein